MVLNFNGRNNKITDEIKPELKHCCLFIGKTDRSEGIIMKKLLFMILLTMSVSYAQFRNDNNSGDIKNSIFKGNSTDSILGFFNPDNFSMHHSFDLSYSTFGSDGMALGVYTNSMAYKFSDKLDLETDISIVNSPYNSFGQSFTKQINGVYLSRAQLNFKASDNMNISIQYRSFPGGLYSPYSFGGYSPFYRDSFADPFGLGK